jgi:hypothetical protein
MVAAADFKRSATVETHNDEGAKTPEYVLTTEQLDNVTAGRWLSYAHFKTYQIAQWYYNHCAGGNCLAYYNDWMRQIWDLGNDGTNPHGLIDM